MRTGELRVAGAWWFPLCIPNRDLACLASLVFSGWFSGRAGAQTDPYWMLSREGQVGKGTLHPVGDSSIPHKAVVGMGNEAGSPELSRQFRKHLLDCLFVCPVPQPGMGCLFKSSHPLRSQFVHPELWLPFWKQWWGGSPQCRQGDRVHQAGRASLPFSEPFHGEEEHGAELTVTHKAAVPTSPERPRELLAEDEPKPSQEPCHNDVCTGLRLSHPWSPSAPGSQRQVAQLHCWKPWQERQRSGFAFLDGG